MMCVMCVIDQTMRQQESYCSLKASRYKDSATGKQ